MSIVSEPRAVATGSFDCGVGISDFRLKELHLLSIGNHIIRSLPLAVLTRALSLSSHRLVIVKKEFLERLSYRLN